MTDGHVNKHVISHQNCEKSIGMFCFSFYLRLSSSGKPSCSLERALLGIRDNVRRKEKEYEKDAKRKTNKMRCFASR